MKSTKPGLGIGIGLRTAHFSELLERAPRVDWFEAISENFMTGGGRPLHVLEYDEPARPEKQAETQARV